uniref:Hexosyltransferase n=1 Tax=Pan troglodytes TaxID=9598 RepID=A0A2I3TN64_PANTR
MRLSSLLALLRPALPLILGLSLGCSLSLLRVSWIQGEGEDPCVEAVGDRGGPQNPDSRARLDQNDEDFKPRIVPYYRDPNKPYKKVLRTRYIQTELGSRERLLVAVLTSRATLSTLAVAVNRTVAHHFPRLLYFTGQRGLNRRYQPRLRFQKQRLLNGYRRFDPARGMEYTLDLLLECVTQRGHRRALARRVSLLRPLSRVEILPMPYVTEATRVQLVLPLLVAEAAAAPAFLEAFAANVLEPREHALLTLLLVYGPREGGRGAPDPFLGVKAAAAELERRYPGTRLAWLAVRAEAPSQVRLMDVVSKKHPVDTLFFLTTVWTRPGPEVLNRCRMNAISGWQAFFPVHFQEFNPALSPQRSPPGPPGAGPDPPSPPGADPSRGAPIGGRFDRQASAEGCFYNADYLAARARLAGELAGQEEEEALEGLEVMDVFLRFSGLHLFRAVEPGLVQKFSLRDCSPRLSEELYHRCRLSNLEGLGGRAQLAMALFEQEQANST